MSSIEPYMQNQGEDEVPDPNPETMAVGAESLALHQEVEDVDLSGIVKFALALFILVIAVHLVLWWILQAWTGETLIPEMRISPAASTAPVAQGPGLQTAPAGELQILLAEESERLATYGWVDREAGAVHIPIEQAMELVVEQGLPARDAEAPAFGLDPAYQLDSSGGTTWDPVESGEETP